MRQGLGVTSKAGIEYPSGAPGNASGRAGGRGGCSRTANLGSVAVGKARRYDVPIHLNIRKQRKRRRGAASAKCPYLHPVVLTAWAPRRQGEDLRTRGTRLFVSFVALCDQSPRDGKEARLRDCESPQYCSQGPWILISSHGYGETDPRTTRRQPPPNRSALACPKVSTTTSPNTTWRSS
jgi:hypothetical protein